MEREFQREFFEKLDFYGRLQAAARLKLRKHESGWWAILIGYRQQKEAMQCRDTK